MAEPPAQTDAPERIEWLELFFDLVVVAAVAVLSEALREDATGEGLGIFLVTYGALWFAWVSVVMYADEAAEPTRVRTVVVSMLLLAVMAAAAPGHAGHRANAFAGAFLLVRLFAARGSLNTASTSPTSGSTGTRSPRRAGAKDAAGSARCPSCTRSAWIASTSTSAWALRDHRARGVGGSARADRVGQRVDPDFVSTSLASFALLVLLWLLTFSYGFASAPGVRLGDLAPLFGLPLHLVSTLGILFIGVGLGEAVASGEHLHRLLLWLACGGLAPHAAASGVGGLLGGAGRFWLLSCALPTVVFPLLVAAVAASLEDGIGDPVLIWLLALPVGWRFLYAQRHSELLRIGRLPAA